VALGLETTHPKVLKALNKKMTAEDFRRSAGWLRRNDIPVRAFILLKPPFLSENEGITWAEDAITFAFDSGAACCVVIPTRSGNGAMEWLEKNGYFCPPDIQSLEKVLEYGVALKRGNVFADLWNIEEFSGCDKCLNVRKKRLEQMNLTQSVPEPVACDCRL
jgi:radical SAM enzyme (TIGR01210 family)